ncbi:MAG: hypothetical protein ABI629_13825 [bacterium]
MARNWRDRAPLFAVLLGFALSRAVAAARGVHFDAFPLGHFWQYLDPSLLRDRLWESLFYLHAQPPLFNLFLGSVLHLWPQSTTAAFAVCYHAVGLGLALSMFALMRQVGASDWLAAALTLLFIVSPPALFFEHYLFSEYPTMLLLCGAGVALHRFLSGGHIAFGAVAFGLMGLAIWTRSHFQLPWLLLVLASVVALCATARRRVLLAAVPGLALTLALYLKNFLVFGTLTTSSWFGMNLMSMATFALPPHAPAELVARGVVTPLFAVPPFNTVATYRGMLELPPASGVPTLDRETADSGNANFNHLAYVSVSTRYRRDAMTVIGMYPGAYLHAVAAATSLFFRPANDYEYFTGFRHSMPLWNALYSRLLCGQWTPAGPVKLNGRFNFDLSNTVPSIGWFILIGMPLLAVLGLRRLRMAHRDGDVATAATLAFILITLAYATFVGVALNIGENERYRFVLEPFLFILWAAACSRRRGAELAEDAEPTTRSRYGSGTK